MSRIDFLKEKACYNGQNRNTSIAQILGFRGLLENEGEHIHNIKRASVISYILKYYPIEFDDNELLVGRYSNKSVTEDEKKELERARNYFFKSGPLYGAESGGTGHRVADYEKVLYKGVKGILEEIAKKEKEISHDCVDAVERMHFYKACKIALEGLLDFARRFKEELIQLYEREENMTRKGEYRKLVDIFSWIPLNPPRDFYEAIQCVWFLQFALSLTDDISLSGRPDQYLYSYYRKGLDEGTMTKEFAMVLIENFYLKTNEIYDTWPGSLMVGGVDKSGRPVFNELTEMFIKAIETTGLVNPSVAVCYNEHMPDELLYSCVDILAKGYTKPAIFNDRVIIDGLVEAGMRLEDARYYIHSTCVEITPVGCSNIHVATPYINMMKGIELLLNAGKEMMGSNDNFNSFNPGIQTSIEDLDSFEKFYSCYKEMLGGMIQKAVICVNKEIYKKSHYSSNPLMSCFTNDCIEIGRDSAAGGARYNYIYPCFPGFSSTVDALNTVRETVYKKRMITLPELKETLASNFEGNESFRQYVLNRCPKYGNDDNEADYIAIDLYDFIKDQLKQYRTCLNGTYHPSYFAWIMHGSLGRVTAASPDGRLEGEALSECIGPVQGMDKEGPTAAANSITKLDHKYGIGGIAANFRFSKAFLDSSNGKKALIDFIKEFMRKGAFEIQLNVIDQKTLLEAKKDREKYRTLLVRVAGYSDYFVNLDPVIQDEIIKRTEYGQV